MSKVVDLIGLRFGRLTVVERASNGKNGKTRWKCICDCGTSKEIIAFGTNLTRGLTQSCGCLHKERITESCKRYNDYEIQEDYVIMYTFKDEPFYVDLEDFWKVKGICWCKNAKGYIVGNNENGKKVGIHSLIMGTPNYMMVDHIHGESTRNDNRKCNLRLATNQQNSFNSKIYSNNTSGTTGVSFSKSRNIWEAYINVNYKKINLGRFRNKQDAIEARKQAEEKYFGEWSYGNSQERSI